MNIGNVLNIFDSVFKSPVKPAPPVPPPLILTGGLIRPGLSPRKIASRIITRQNEAGAPIGPLPDGSESITEKMELIRVEEIIKSILTEAKITIVLPPGIPTVGTGANAGGPVVTVGTTVAPGIGTGIIQ